MSTEPQTAWAKFADVDRKKKFAALCRVRPDSNEGRFEAACLVFPDQEDTQLALKAMNEWRYDPIVIQEMATLAAAEEKTELPSREQQARDVYRLASDNTKGIDDRLKAHKLYADLMGFVQKPTDNSGSNVYIDNRRVMVMPSPANSADEWEATAKKHQAGLVIDAASTLANR